MIKGITHIGIAVRNIETSKRLFRELFGVEADHEETVAGQKVKTAMFRIGSTAIELLEATEPDSAIARFIDSRGEGIHHVSLDVDNIDGELSRLKKSGFRLVDESARPGADHCLVAFLHPKSTNGVLIELSQRA